VSPLSQSSAFSLARTSTVASSKSPSSLSSLSGPVERPTNLFQVDERGTLGCVLDKPDPSRLVIFLPRTQDQGQGPATSGLLLVIDSESTPTTTLRPPPISLPH
jgi:hypothetical protein